MQEVNLYQLFTDKLNDNNIKYAITGSVASIIYGEPRTTHDIDIVLEIDTSRTELLPEIFLPDEFYCPPIEVLKTEVLRDSRGHCNIIHLKTGFKADLYFCGRNKFEKWAVTNAKEFEFNGSKISVSPVEYVIIKKLEFYKEGYSQKHLEDVKAIVFNSKDIIDFAMLEKYVTDFGLQAEWMLCI